MKAKFSEIGMVVTLTAMLIYSGFEVNADDGAGVVEIIYPIRKAKILHKFSTVTCKLPRVEAMLVKGGVNHINPPIEVKITVPKTFTTTASYYGQGDGFAGKPMANGERYDPSDPTTVASQFLPLGTPVKIRAESRITGWSALKDGKFVRLVKTRGTKYELAKSEEGLFIGDIVSNSNKGLNVRTVPNGSVIESLPINAQGKVLRGPVNSGGRSWWKVDWKIIRQLNAKVKDRGTCIAGRGIDLSVAAAEILMTKESGVAPVQVTIEESTSIKDTVSTNNKSYVNRAEARSYIY